MEGGAGASDLEATHGELDFTVGAQGFGIGQLDAGAQAGTKASVQALQPVLERYAAIADSGAAAVSPEADGGQSGPQLAAD